MNEELENLMQKTSMEMLGVMDINGALHHPLGAIVPLSTLAGLTSCLIAVSEDPAKSKKSFLTLFEEALETALSAPAELLGGVSDTV